MAIGKPRGKAGMIPVYVYDASTRPRRKVYVGQRATLREARLLESQKTVDFARGSGFNWLVSGWIQHWLEEHHGPGTKRPDPATKTHNDQATRDFISVFGGRKLGSITREEAEKYARSHYWQVKSIAAAFADAESMGHLPRNPFARLGIKQRRGRADITPLTEAEIDRLCEIATATHGVYGRRFAALIRFAAWTGIRPGELCALEWTEIDLAKGEAHIWWSRGNDGQRKRTKTKQNRTIQLAPQAVEALLSLPGRTGTVFTSPTGKVLRQNSLTGSAGYWTPVRLAFAAELPASHWLPRRLRQSPDKPLVPYELRHFCGSLLADRGLTARDISEHLGNSPRVCEVYIHAHEARVAARIRAAFEAPSTTDLRVVGSDLGSEATG